MTAAGNRSKVGLGQLGIKRKLRHPPSLPASPRQLPPRAFPPDPALTSRPLHSRGLSTSHASPASTVLRAKHPPPVPPPNIPAFGCLKCISGAIAAAVFHPSAIRHLRVHSTQKITYKQQLPPADPPPHTHQLLILSQRQTCSGAVFI